MCDQGLHRQTGFFPNSILVEGGSHVAASTVSVSPAKTYDTDTHWRGWYNRPTPQRKTRIPRRAGGYPRSSLVLSALNRQDDRIGDSAATQR